MKTKNQFEAEYLDEAIGESEEGRIRFLLVFFGILSIVVYILHFFFADFFTESLGNTFKYKEMRVVFPQIFAYYLVVFAIILFFRKKNKGNLPWLGRALNAIAEGCIPSISMYSTANHIDLSFSLAGPASFSYGIFIILSAIRLDFRLCLITAGTSAISFYFVSNLLISQYLYQYWGSFLFEPIIIVTKSILLLLTGVCAAYVALQVRKRVFSTFQHIQEREEVKNLLGTHVSPEIAYELTNNKKINVGEERDLSIMFLDIRNFTTFSEARETNDVFIFLNEFFDPVIKIINERGGVINKFLGDGFMAIFGAPIHDDAHAEKAVKSAIKIQEHIKEQSKNTSTHVRIGIGIHSGKAMAGNIGSNLRKEYTIIGDVVNLASRIEQLNKKLTSEVLVSKEAIDACREIPLQAENLGEFDIKGRQEKITIFKLA